LFYNQIAVSSACLAHVCNGQKVSHANQNSAENNLKPD